MHFRVDRDGTVEGGEVMSLRTNQHSGLEALGHPKIPLLHLREASGVSRIHPSVHNFRAPQRLHARLPMEIGMMI